MLCQARTSTGLLKSGEFVITQNRTFEKPWPFEEWVIFLREQLHRRAVEVYYTLAQYYQRAAEYEQMQRYAARQLALEPWREEAHHQVMWALAAAGHRSAALAQYHRGNAAGCGQRRGGRRKLWYVCAGAHPPGI
jgi:DNA-binding SARP family transcriptional activator